MQISYTDSQIRNYFIDIKSDRENVKKYNESHLLKKKVGNISEEATESLAYNLIVNGIILKEAFEKTGIYSIKRKGKKGKDILVNDFFTVEVKGTSSKSGFITTSKSNFKSSAWIWFDIKPFFENQQNIVVYVIKNPKCLNPYKIEANGESKFSLKKAKEIAKNNNCLEEVVLDFNTFGVKTKKENSFFS